MKVCDVCGNEIYTRDGDNRCQTCADASKKKKEAAKLARRERDAAMRSIGIVKVRGAMGGVYWE